MISYIIGLLGKRQPRNGKDDIASEIIKWIVVMVVGTNYETYTHHQIYCVSAQFTLEMNEFPLNCLHGHIKVPHHKPGIHVRIQDEGISPTSIPKRSDACNEYISVGVRRLEVLWGFQNQICNGKGKRSAAGEAGRRWNVILGR